MKPIPLSLYIHIPWCIKKCPYCDFNSHEARNDVPELAYVKALLKDLETELPHIWGRPIASIFIGGGTPSLFSAQAIDLLMSGLRERLPIRPNIEITLEANPSTFEQERFSAYRKSGINRLSIGVQSFSNSKLKALGRVHDSAEALKAASIAQQAGFDNFNLDLMFGLPQQTKQQALDDLQQAINCSPQHLSWYQLTIEENTLFHHAPPILPNDDLLWELQEAGQSLLADAGFRQYEVSAYAKPKQQCHHNNNYWQYGDYLGIGAGAHGKLSMPDGSIIRHLKVRHPEQYIKQAMLGEPRSATHLVEEKDRPFEFMLNALRLKDGFSAVLFSERTRLDFASVEQKIEQLTQKGLLNSKDNKYWPTTKGWAFLNDMMGVFIED
jgi:oxygen-independent coproporphyrinogen-3 oxidase